MQTRLNDVDLVRLHAQLERAKRCVAAGLACTTNDRDLLASTWVNADYIPEGDGDGQ